MRIVLCFPLLLALCPGFAAAQGNAAGLRGPWLGMLIDPAVGSVRPLRGLPGAATLGPKLDVTLALDQAQTASRGLYALGLDRKDGGVVAVTPERTRKLSGLTPYPEQIVFSPLGTMAALYYGGAAVVDVVAGLPATPSRIASLDVSALPGLVTALAVSETGLVLAASTSGPDAAVVFAFRNHRPATPVLSAQRISALAFAGATSDALAADVKANLIYRVHGSGGGVIAGSGEGIASPAALAASADGLRAVVSDGGGGKVVVLDLAGGPARPVTCSCRASVVEPLAGNAVFRLTAPGERQVWLLDAERPEPRLLFVPEAEDR